ncbi:hypothetical protein [Kribbella catacumbae]|uniref:hypothetical protein n=1 Tax=Kribbella catacumbae TaxID=460086 RepID=UPI0003727ED6|nr:hypothetical protein [Kribbella catacumbae]
MLRLTVSGRLVDGEIEVGQVLTLDTAPVRNGPCLPGARLDLIDEAGRIVATAPVSWDGDGAISAVIPDPPRGSTLRIVRDEEEVWIREPAGAPPRVEGLRGTVDGVCVRLTWQEEVYVDRPLRLLRWSADEGETWQLLDAAVEAEEATIPAALLPRPALVQVVVADGFDTAVSEWLRR